MVITIVTEVEVLGKYLSVLKFDNNFFNKKDTKQLCIQI